MTTNSLFPAAVQINYHGALAPHTMTIPTKVHNAGAGSGSFDTWAGGTISADTMINALVTLMLPFFNSDTVFDNYIINEYADAVSPADPVYSAPFVAKVGSDGGASWAGAVESIIIARTDAFGIAKLSLLDSISNNDFNPILSASGALSALLTEWFALTNGWSGRDNAKPSTFMKMTLNLNQKLRKEYRLD